MSASALSTLTQSGAIRTAVPRAGTITVQRQKSPIQQGAVRIIQQGTGASGATQVINLGSGANIMSGTKTITVSHLSSTSVTLWIVNLFVYIFDLYPFRIKLKSTLAGPMKGVFQTPDIGLFLSPPVQVARWALMCHCLSVCLW